MTIRVSVIIPIYNVQKYLAECLNSLANQSFKDFEVLLVDNNSTDASLSVCYDYLQDTRFRLLSCKKQGAAAARNIGLRHAQGEYVAFVDADDCVCTTFLDNLIRVAETSQAEIVMFKYCHNKGMLYNEASAYNMSFYQLSSREFYEIVFSLWSEKYQNKIPYGGHIGNKLIKTAAIKNIRFNEEILGAEDEIFLFNLRNNVRNIVYIPLTLYFYRIRSQSVHLSSGFYSNTLQNRLSLLTLKLNPCEKKIVRLAYVKSCLFTVRNLILSNNSPKAPEIIKIKELSKYSFSILKDPLVQTNKFGRFYFLDFMLLYLLHNLPVSLSSYVFHKANILWKRFHKYH